MRSRCGLVNQQPTIPSQEELDAVDRSDRVAWLRALDQQVAGDDRTPAAAARRVEKAAGKAKGFDDLRLAMMAGRKADAAPQQIDADQRKIAHHERPCDRGVE